MQRSRPTPRRRATTAGLLLAFALPTFARAEPVRPRVEVDHQAVLAEAEGAVYVLVDFDVALPETSPERPELDLAVVIDRSCSMLDNRKMEYARAAAKRIVDALRPTDRLAVVEYDDRVSVLWPAAPVASRELVKRRIDQLSPRGSTNLAGGLAEGGQQLARLDQRGGRQSRVLLLSDGIANAGITEPAKIQALAAQMRRSGVPVTTLGLGVDFNEDLMQGVAQAGGGRYWFIEHPEQLGRIFQEEISALAASVAKDVRLHLDLGPLAASAAVFGHPGEVKGRRTTVVQDDLWAGEKRAVLFQVKTAPERAGRHLLGTLLLEYRDVATGAPRAIEKEIYLQVSGDAAEVARSINPRVQAEAALMEADRAHAEAAKLFEKGDRRAAKATLGAVSDKLAKDNQALKDKRISKKLEGLAMEDGAMDAAEADPTARSVYVKKSKMKAYLGTRAERGTYFLEEGTKGYFVERLQKALKDGGHYPGAADGRFSPELTEAVKAFQAKQGLEADGIAGPKTLAALGLD